MKLYYSPASPFARKVRVVLHETGQADQVEMVDVASTPTAPDAALSSANPLAKIPALERADGPAIYDSRVICAYLDARAGTGLAGDGARRWEIATLEATADGIMEAALLMVYEARFRPEDKQMADWVEAQWSKAARGLDVLNQRWMSHLSGPLDMGQIAVGCALGYLDLRHEARNWRSGRDALAAWCDSFAARPAMAQSAPPMA